jgi:hypothetical protein
MASVLNREIHTSFLQGDGCVNKTEDAGININGGVQCHVLCTTIYLFHHFTDLNGEHAGRGHPRRTTYY